MAVSRKKVITKKVKRSEKKNIDSSLLIQMVRDRAYYI